jgi:CHAD domain-containing protein
MVFRFKRKESVTKAVRRIGRGRLVRIRQSLDDFGRIDAIHNARKEIKKLRAVLRLFQDKIGQDIYRKLNKDLRKAAEILTVPRDANVKFKALRELLRTAHLKNFHQLKNIASRNCRKEVRRFAKGKSIARIKQRLKEANHLIKNLKIHADDWGAIETGWRHSYHRGRLAYEQILKAPSAENFHKWRKRVKDLWYQQNLLCPVWPKKIRAPNGQLKALGELLGDDHDLAMLKQFIAEASTREGNMEGVSTLKRLIETRKINLRATALKIGATFYAQPLQPVCAGLKRRWKTWRSKS